MVMVMLNGMKNTLVPIDRAGRIVLPKGVRQELAIKAGDLFSVSIQGTAVRLTPNKEATGLVRKGKALVFSTGGDETLSEEAVSSLLNEGRQERDVRNEAGGLGGNGRNEGIC